MKRRFIRLVGWGLAMICGLVGRANAFTTTGKSGHANWSESYMSRSVSGAEFISRDSFLSGNETNENLSSRCSGGTGTGTGAEVSLRCIWWQCIDMDINNPHDNYNLSGCSGSSHCNGTGMYCTQSGFFVGLGASSSSVQKYTSFNETVPIRQFVGCDNGWYRSSTGAPCDFSTGEDYSVSSFSGCCTPCPGLKDFNSGTAGVTTYTHGLDTNSAGGYSWGSDSSATAPADVTACRGYLSGTNVKTTWTDAVGTYEIPYCNYVK